MSLALGPGVGTALRRVLPLGVPRPRRVERPIGSLDVRPTVSVVVPCYNYGHFLPECVASVLSQTDVDVEVVVVDDASPDGSGEVADGLARQEDRVRVVRHDTNRGHIATYNDGLRQVSGDYVVLLSADDLLPPGSLARATALMGRDASVGLVYGRALMFDDVVPATNHRVTSWSTWAGHDWLEGRCRTGQNPVNCPEVVMRRSVLEEVGPYRHDLPHGADFAMWLAASAVSDVAYIGGSTQGLYRVHGANMSRATFGLHSPAGIVRDLEEKRACFEAVWRDHPTATDGGRRPALAAKSLADVALRIAIRTYVWGVADSWPVQELARFASETSPPDRSARLWASLSRRQSLGPIRARHNPSLVPREAADRLRERVETRRRESIGV